MNLAKQSSIYTLTSFIVAGIPFLLLPVLTDYLTPKDYGIISLFNSSVRVIMPFITVGIITSISLEFFKLKKAEFVSYFSSVLIIPVIAFFLVLIGTAFFGQYFADLIGVDSIIWVFLIPLLALFSTSEEVALIILRNQKKAFSFGMVKILKAIFEISLSLYLIIVLSFQWEGRIYSWTITAAIASFCSLYFFKKSKLFKIRKIRKTQVLSALAFGLPLIPERISVFVLNISDRFFIAEMEGVDEVGTYAVGSQIGMVILILTGALLQSFIPFQYEKMKLKTRVSKIEIVRFSYVLMGVLLVVFFFLVILTPTIFSFINERFVDAQQFVFWIGLGYLFEAVYNLFYQYLLFHKRTRLIALITLISVFINLILNYVFINWFGTIGAAYATLFSYGFVSTIAFIVSNKIEPMPWLAFKEIVSINSSLRS